MEVVVAAEAQRLTHEVGAPPEDETGGLARRGEHALDLGDGHVVEHLVGIEVQLPVAARAELVDRPVALIGVVLEGPIHDLAAQPRGDGHGVVAGARIDDEH